MSRVFYSLRSRRVYLGLGGLATGLCVIFLVVSAFTNSGDYLNALTVYVLVVLVPCVLLLVNAFFTARVTLRGATLRYCSFVRTHEFEKSLIDHAFTDLRSRAPSPRRFNQPILVFKDGNERALSDFSTPFSSDSAEIASRIEAHGDTQTDKISLDSMAEWINSWATHEEWVRETSSGTGIT